MEPEETGWLIKHIPATTEEKLEAVFSTHSMQRLHKDQWTASNDSVVTAGD